MSEDPLIVLPDDLGAVQAFASQNDPLTSPASSWTPQRSDWPKLVAVRRRDKDTGFEAKFNAEELIVAAALAARRWTN